jgi:glycosyltransferase involved in cell wall biosynthesis
LSKQRILIDVTRSPASGIGRYSWDLFEYLNLQFDHYEFIGLCSKAWCPYAVSRSLPVHAIERYPQNDQEVREISIEIEKLADVYIPTNFTQLVFPKIPRIHVVHDIIYLLQTQWLPSEIDMEIRFGKNVMSYVKSVHLPKLKEELSGYLGKWRELLTNSFVHELFTYAQAHAILTSDALITVSRTTKERVEEYFEIHQPIKVVYPPIDPRASGASLTPSSSECQQIVLYIGSFETRKNHKLLFEAIGSLPKWMRDGILVVLIGQKLYQSHYEEFLREVLEYRKKFTINVLQDISEEEKNHWLKKASVLVHASLDEGFGIPLLEAMFNGLPIVTLDSEVGREVCGDAAMYVKGESSELLAQAIDKVLHDTTIQRNMIRKQKEQVKKFDRAGLTTDINDLLSYCLSLTKAQRNLSP